MPLVSVITPCYNGEKYLHDCIRSVLSQSFMDWEHIIIDDGSIDNSISVIQYYCNIDSRIKCISMKKASGSPSIPRNIGIDQAIGQYLAFLDCDDIWYPTKLEEQLYVFKEKKCAMVFSNYEKISSQGIASNRIITSPSIIEINQMYYGNPIGCLTVIVDTNITGKFHFKQMHHEDCIAWIELISKFGAAYNTNTVLAQYRVTEGSVSRNKFKIILWQWYIYRKVFKFNMLKSLFYYIIYVYNGCKKLRI